MGRGKSPLFSRRGESSVRVGSERNPRSGATAPPGERPMLGRLLPALVLGAVAFFVWNGSAGASEPPLTRFHYYPYYYWPHNYWPTQGPAWPESPGSPYMRPPAY